VVDEVERVRSGEIASYEDAGHGSALRNPLDRPIARPATLQDDLGL